MRETINMLSFDAYFPFQSQRRKNAIPEEFPKCAITASVPIPNGRTLDFFI